MKELLRIAQAAKVVNTVHYTDLQKNDVVGLRLVVPAIQDDVTALNEKE